MAARVRRGLLANSTIMVRLFPHAPSSVCNHAAKMCNYCPNLETMNKANPRPLHHLIITGLIGFCKQILQILLKSSESHEFAPRRKSLIRQMLSPRLPALGFVRLCDLPDTHRVALRRLGPHELEGLLEKGIERPFFARREAAALTTAGRSRAPPRFGETSSRSPQSPRSSITDDGRIAAEPLDVPLLERSHALDVESFKQLSERRPFDQDDLPR